MQPTPPPAPFRMREVVVKLDGSGTDDDPWRLPFPTGSILEINRHNGTARAAVLEDDLRLCPPDEHDHTELPSVHRVMHEHSFAPDDITDEHLPQIHNWLDERYREHRGRFRPLILPLFEPEPRRRNLRGLLPRWLGGR